MFGGVGRPGSTGGSGLSEEVVSELRAGGSSSSQSAQGGLALESGGNYMCQGSRAGARVHL